MGCKGAREFLARRKTDFEERDILEEPLSEAELRRLAKPLGGPRELVAPKRRKETSGLSEAELVPFLAKNPGYVRRPIIDAGGVVLGGFTAEVKQRLEEAL